MSDVLKNLYNACNPLTPARAEYYVDCSDVRGNHALTSALRTRLSDTEGSNFLRVLFSGHVGCGKSSELQHLAANLEQPAPATGHKRYLPIVLDAGEYIDNYDVATTDILLAIVAELADTLREKGIGKLADSYFQKRFSEMKDFLFSDIEVEKGEFSLAGAKVGVTRLKKDPDARAKVREILKPKLSSFLEEINTVFDQGRLMLGKWTPPSGEAAYSDFVLILDNLEKINQVAGHDEGEASLKELFLEGASQLTSLNCHIVYTVPLRLVRSHGPQLRAAYGATPVVLPMIKVIERNGTYPFDAGVEKMREILRKRAGGASLDTIINEDAFQWLVRYSGGHVRDLMEFVQAARTYVAEPPINLEAARRALGQTISLFSTSIPTAHWAKMAALDRSVDKIIDNDDRDYQLMLEQVSVMEYANGDDGSNPFRHEAPWYAVNPIVRELSQFKAALAKFDE